MHASGPAAFAAAGAAWLAGAALGCPAGRGTGAVQPPGEPDPVVAFPGMPDDRALVDGFTPAHPRRAVLAAIGAWRLTPDEAWRPSEEGASWWAPFDVLVAEEVADAVRVVVERDDLRYATWVQTPDLAVLPTARVVLVPAPDEAVAPGGPSIQLAPGAPVVVLERKDGWALLGVADPGVSAQGWVRETRVGRIYEDDDFNVRGEILDLRPAPGTPVYDRPDGVAMAVLRPDAELELQVKSLGPATDGWREVLYPAPTLFVRGWVRAEAVEPAPAASPGPATHSTHGYDASATIWLDVSAGTEVRTGPDGEVFALCYADTKLILHPVRLERGVEVGVHTLWGEATGWVACEPPPEGELPEHVPCAPLGAR